MILANEIAQIWEISFLRNQLNRWFCPNVLFQHKSSVHTYTKGGKQTYCVKFLKSRIVLKRVKIKYVFWRRKVLNCRMNEKFQKMLILAHEVNQVINCSTYVPYCTIFTILEATHTCYILNGMQSSETVENWKRKIYFAFLIFDINSIRAQSSQRIFDTYFVKWNT